MDAQAGRGHSRHRKSFDSVFRPATGGVRPGYESLECRPGTDGLTVTRFGDTWTPCTGMKSRPGQLPTSPPCCAGRRCQRGWSCRQGCSGGSCLRSRHRRPLPKPQPRLSTPSQPTEARRASQANTGRPERGAKLTFSVIRSRSCGRLLLHNVLFGPAACPLGSAESPSECVQRTSTVSMP